MPAHVREREETEKTEKTEETENALQGQAKSRNINLRFEIEGSPLEILNRGIPSKDFRWRHPH